MFGKPEPGGDIDKTEYANGAVHQKSVDCFLGSFGLALENVVEECCGCAKVIEKVVDPISDRLREHCPVTDCKRTNQHPIHRVIESEHSSVKGLKRVRSGLGDSTARGREHHQSEQGCVKEPGKFRECEPIRHHGLSPLNARANPPRYRAAR